MLKNRLLLTALFAVAIATANVHATGTVDTDVSSMIDSATATFTAIKAVIVTIALFFVGYRLLKKLRA